ncbi:molecular chaperone TorD family protein [Halomonas campisalis]|uniref:Molecular chaperone TorD family protein n=1 Tax=Billgrantia campisalis TaxID=74661 RepID=A0ABS9P7Q0_9GAMM|nr:molecular chaperone TorD family protein [Halomonas campisalis]MCG6657793.1 molecular chaperone TorD family protein [Halomonas campisalis]MDR5864735.1 molecular chaperone TorD family protein [Halomonas campisalis]
MNRDIDPLASAELYLCLSRAFLTPLSRVTLPSLREGLLPDLQELAEGLPAIDAEWLATFRETLEAIPTSERLLVGYSRLFLTPPAPAPLNLGGYLDGGLMGQSSRLIEALYHRHRLDRDAGFHDLPDHLALNLEWFAWVLSRLEQERTAPSGDDATAATCLADLRHMAGEITLPAVTRMQQKLAAMADDAPPEQRLWHLLVGLTRRQLQRDLADWAPLVRQLGTPSEQPFHEVSSEQAPEQAASVSADDGAYGRQSIAASPLACRVCGGHFTPDATLAEMHQRLKAAGLSAAHLAVCPRCSEVDTSRPAMPGATHAPPATAQPARRNEG